ncbi:hypothetical protein ACFYQA_19975 [Streptomyces sp. NPDC005774]|uniref:hypothetical protein n=1 Tax=Streptomyces sp. NPDC005774 TaxID=3364728 RepID=UPI00369F4D1C
MAVSLEEALRCQEQRLNATERVRELYSQANPFAEERNAIVDDDLLESGVFLVGGEKGANRSWSVSGNGSWTRSRSLRTSRTVWGVLVARVRSASGGTDRVRGPGRRVGSLTPGGIRSGLDGPMPAPITPVDAGRCRPTPDGIAPTTRQGHASGRRTLIPPPDRRRRRPLTKSFAASYRRRHRRAPTPWAAEACDAVRYAAHGPASTDGDGRPALRAELLRRPWQGITRRIAFDADGHFFEPNDDAGAFLYRVTGRTARFVARWDDIGGETGGEA